MSMPQGPGALVRQGRARLGIPTTIRTNRRRKALAWATRMLVIAALIGMPGARALPDEPKKGSSAKSTPVPVPRSKPTATPSASTSTAAAARAVDQALPLHEQIDRLIEARLARELPGQQPAAPATDAELLRRTWLDLAGMIPTPGETRAFLDDPSPYKRQALVDRLLESPAYARRMQQVFDVMLMERRPDVYVPSAPWREFLHQAFTENRPYDVLVRQILAADGTDPATRPAARFLLDREADPNIVTRDVGRLFLGRDMTCCQCHDHPLIDDYKQQHYYGLYAYLGRTVLAGGKEADGSIKPGSVAMLGEKAEGEVTFSSVFKKKIVHKTGPRVLEGRPPAEPARSSAAGRCWGRA